MEFVADDPSRIMQQPTDVYIGGVKATMFFSSDALLGPTREVWFLHGGYLFEVTTYKDQDQWLAAVMSMGRASRTKTPGGARGGRCRCRCLGPSRGAAM